MTVILNGTAIWLLTAVVLIFLMFVNAAWQERRERRECNAPQTPKDVFFSTQDRNPLAWDEPGFFEASTADEAKNLAAKMNEAQVIQFPSTKDRP